MADNFGPNDVYANIPAIDTKGRRQIPMFLRWNSDPVANDANNLAALNPNLQKVVAQARSDNPNLRFVIGNGRRSAADQDQAKAWGWSQVGSKDGGDANVHMAGNAVDLWGLDSNGHVQFDPDQQKQINQAIQDAAKKVGVGVNWGGDFKTFKDAPHFELVGGGSAASSGAPEGPPTTASTPAPAAQGTTLNSSNVIDTLSRNIAGIESTGWANPYEALNPTTHAIGKYQVMPNNVPGWTMAALGHSMTPDEFKASPAAQEAVFRDQMQRNLQLYSPKDAASIWFTGKPYNVAGGAVKDAVGTTNASYVARATAGLPDSGTFTPNAAPGPIDPSIVARGGVSPPIPTDGTTPGTTLTSVPANSGGLPGLGAPQSNQLLQNLNQFDKSLTGRGFLNNDQQQGGQEQPDIRPVPIAQGPGLRNASSPASIEMQARQMTPNVAGQLYGQTLNSQPLAWSNTPIGAPSWLAQSGQQGQPQGLGTSLNSQQMAYGLSPQQLQMLMSPMMLSQDSSYG